MHLKMTFVKWRQFCLGLNVLMCQRGRRVNSLRPGMHKYIWEHGHLWFQWWPVTCLALMPHLKQLWHIVNWTFRNKHQNSNIFMKKISIKYDVRDQWVNNYWLNHKGDFAIKTIPRVSLEISFQGNRISSTHWTIKWITSLKFNNAMWELTHWSLGYLN